MLPYRCCSLNRRQFLADLGFGFTGLALGALLFEDRLRSKEPSTIGADAEADIPLIARAKNVIWLFMMGGVSHLESFDPKPALNKYAGKSIARTPFKGVLQAPELTQNVRSFGIEYKLTTPILPLQIGYQKRGQSGIEVSDWWPHVGDCIDDIAVVRSLWTTDFQHSAQLQMHTGRNFLDGREPSIGSWVHYGLGSLNEQLPRFLVLGRPPSDFGGGLGSHTASYLGPEHDGVPVGVDPETALPYPPPHTREDQRRQQKELELLGRLNHLASVEYPEDSALRARIKAYELACGMQMAYPEILDFKGESPETRALYGLENQVTRPFGTQCLVARRLVERGVRFVQIYHGGSPDDDNGLWDAHKNLRDNHGKMCPQVDQPIGALLKDLKRRGMLESTLVVWATEFGRAPNLDLRGATDAEARTRSGRDHHIYGFSCWMAGGGVKGGVAHGRTDELGYHAVENRHYVTDLHATVLHQLGLDARKLEIPGRKRLKIDVGTPIREIIS
jgi:Protein of unknown function (DUF1501)